MLTVCEGVPWLSLRRPGAGLGGKLEVDKCRQLSAEHQPRWAASWRPAGQDTPGVPHRQLKKPRRLLGVPTHSSCPLHGPKATQLQLFSQGLTVSKPPFCFADLWLLSNPLCADGVHGLGQLLQFESSEKPKEWKPGRRCLWRWPCWRLQHL